MHDLFAERLVNVHIHQGVARLDFARLESVDPEKNQATLAPSLRLVLPLDAFMQAADQMHKVREAIIQESKKHAETKPSS